MAFTQLRHLLQIVHIRADSKMFRLMRLFINDWDEFNQQLAFHLTGLLSIRNESFIFTTNIGFSNWISLFTAPKLLSKLSITMILVLLKMFKASETNFEFIF